MLISLGMLIRLRMDRSQRERRSTAHETKSLEKEETPVGVEN
jgi:hypothetical protein